MSEPPADDAAPPPAAAAPPELVEPSRKRPAEDKAAPPPPPPAERAEAANAAAAPAQGFGFAAAAKGFGFGAAAAGQSGGFGGFAAVAQGGFGAGAGGFGGSAPAPAAPAVPLFGAPAAAAAASDEEAGAEEEEAPAADFKPLVSLPEAAPLTGEEGERSVFSATATLFAFEAPPAAGAASTWRERGRGEVRCNVGRGEPAAARLVMRAAGNLRLILNAAFFRGMAFSALDGGKGVSFAAANAAEGEAPVMRTYAVRLRGADAEAKGLAFREALEATLAAVVAAAEEEPPPPPPPPPAEEV